MKLSGLLSVCCVFASSWAVDAAEPAVGREWSQFRGPNGQGHSSVQGIPVQWSEQEGIAWKQAIPGRGWSSPVIRSEEVWMTTALRDGHSLHAICVLAKSGKVTRDVEVFAPEHPVPLNAKNSHASPSAVIDGDRVFVHFGSMGTACLSADSGEVLWRNQDLVVDHKEGPGSSPIPFQKLLIVNCDGQDHQYVAALDQGTGHIVWQTKRSAPIRERPDFRKAFSTPALIDVAGKPQLVSTGADQVNAYDPLTGREIWRVRYTGFSGVPIPLIDRGQVYVVTDFSRPQLWAIRADGQGDVTDSHVTWKLTRQVGASSSPVLLDGRIYDVTDQGVLTSIDSQTGKPVWQERLGGTFSASMLCLDRLIYATSEQGKTTVIEPNDAHRVVAVNQLDGRIFATPAVIGRALLIRTDSHLYRVEPSGSGR